MGNSLLSAGGATGEGGHPGCALAGAQLMKVQVVATPILEVAGVKAYHTSVVIGRSEYFFDADGIITAPALWSHTGIDGKVPPKQEPLGTTLTEVIDMGITPVSPEAFMRAMSPFFLAGTYDIILKNCNTFSDAALYFLTRTRIQGRFSRLERLIATARPFSTRLLSIALHSIQQEEQQIPMGYTTNPLAEHFSIEDVIVACDTADIARWGRTARKSKALSWCSQSGPWDISGCCQATTDTCLRDIVENARDDTEACEVLTMETTPAHHCKEPVLDAVKSAHSGSRDPDQVARAAELLPVHSAMSSLSPLSNTRRSLAPEAARGV